MGVPLPARQAVTSSARGVLGRTSELETIDDFLSGVATRATALVIEGEAGIGKTTLWRAGVTEARRRGFRVLACTPGSSETRLSFAALTDLLGDSLEGVGDRLPAPQRRALEVALLLNDPADGSAEQRTVAAATLSTLRAIAATQPLLLAIDDMQWLDEPSAGALAFALRRLGDAPVSVLAAKRIGQAAADVPALETALIHRHDEGVERLHVGPLSIAALYAAIQERLRLSFPHHVMRRLQQTSGGNPFYALEVARLLTRRSTRLEPGIALPVPENLHALVRARLDNLPESVQELLAIVAALSDPNLAIVEAAGAGEIVEDAVLAGVIEHNENGRLRFAHPLLASGAYARLTPSARRALHIRLAELVEGEERARHLALGAKGPSANVAGVIHDAAREAAGRGAIGTAAELAEQAIRLTPPERVDDLRSRHLEAAGYEMRHGDTKGARQHLEPLLDQLPRGSIRAGVLICLARLHEEEAVRALELCRQAIAEAGPADVRTAEAHQLAAEMSMLSGDIPNAMEHARRACHLAEIAGDRAILIESLGTLCHYQTYTGSIERGLLERAVELEREQARPSNNYSPAEILGLRLMYADRLEEARDVLEKSLATATELGDELDKGSLLAHLAQLECRAGRLAVADRHARGCVATHEQAGWNTSASSFAMALVAAHLGRIEEARAAAEEGATLAAEGGNEVFRVLNLWARGFLELSLGDNVGAVHYLRPLPDALDRMGYWNPGVRPVYADAIEARIGSGDLDVAMLIDELERRGRALDNPWACAASSRCRGLLLAARGEAVDAIREFEHALVEHERSPQPFERARTLLALGSTLRRAKRRREARTALTEALEVFDSLGTPLWAEKATAELARIPGRRVATGELSETERRIAELVAEGLSNKEVAVKLFVTVRTVEANLSKAYLKLGVRSRTEMARRLTRRTNV